MHLKLKRGRIEVTKKSFLQVQPENFEKKPKEELRLGIYKVSDTTKKRC